MIQKFLKAHWLGLFGLALLAFFMCCDVEFSSQVTKVDAEGEYVMTRSYGTNRGNLVFSVIGKQVDDEVRWAFHRPFLGSIWFERSGTPGMWNASFPIWILVLGTLGGMAVASALPPPRKTPPAATTPPAPPTPPPDAQKQEPAKPVDP